MKPVIYADTLFLFNFFMNTVILIITAKLLHIEIAVFRIALSSAMGAVYSVLMFFPSYGILYSLMLKLIILFGIEYTAFGGKSVRSAVKNFLMFLLVNICLGGGVMALIFMTDFGTTVGAVVSGFGIYINLSPLILIFGITETYILLGIYRKMCKRRLYEKSLIKRMTINYRGKAAEVDVFLDTGCRAIDPITDEGIIIVHYDAVKLILNTGERGIIENCSNIMRVYENKMRVIPFSTMGGDNVIYGIVADRVGGENFSKEKVTVGIIKDRKFDGDYKGIVNPELLLAEENITEGSLL